MDKNYREDVVNLFLIIANEECGIKPNDYMNGYQSVSEIRCILNSNNNIFTAVIEAIEEFPHVPDDPAVKAFYELNTQLKEYVSRTDKLVDLSQYTWYEFLMNLDTTNKNEQNSQVQNQCIHGLFFVRKVVTIVNDIAKSHIENAILKIGGWDKPAKVEDLVGLTQDEQHTLRQFLLVNANVYPLAVGSEVETEHIYYDLSSQHPITWAEIYAYITNFR